MSKLNEHGLTDKQQAFCNEYLKDFNGTQAAIRAGYSEKTANEQAARLLANVSIKNYIESHQKEAEKQTQLDFQWVLNRFKEISDRCMTAEPVMIRDGNEMVESGEYQFDSSGANKATEMIGKLLGHFERDNNQKNGLKIILLDDD